MRNSQMLEATRSRFSLIAYLYNDWPAPDGDWTKPWVIGNDVRLQRVEPWMQSESVTGPLGRIQRDIVAERDRFVISVNYELETSETDAVDRLADATTALWLARPSAVGSLLRLNLRWIEGDRWVPMRIGTAKRLYALSRYKDARLNAEDLVSAQGLYTALTSLQPEGPVRIAARALLDALHDASWPLRYVLLWIALEALFGAPSGGEAMFRLTYRMAMFLKGPGGEGRDLFRRAKKDYSIRSDIVHGMRERDIADSDEVMAAAEEWVREALRRVLFDSRVTEKFNGKARDQWLEEMVFGVHD